MAYDPLLADRVRDCLSHFALGEGEVIGETKMFGGLCFTLNGKMPVGIDKQARIVIRIGTEDFSKFLADGKVAVMDFTGKPMRNFAFVPESSFQSEVQLAEWIELSLEYVRDRIRHEGSKRRREQ